MQPLADESGPRFTGAMFETIGAGEASPHRFTASDILAVSMLSVDVPARVSIALLENDAEHAADLLAAIPVDIDLADAEPAHIAPGSAAWQLWDLLRSYDEVGPTIASKLMARKRPRLIPIQDSVVTATLSHPRRGDFWAAMREALGGTVANGMTLSGWLRAAQNEAQIPRHVTQLRVFDVLVWMNGKQF